MTESGNFAQTTVLRPCLDFEHAAHGSASYLNYCGHGITLSLDALMVLAMATV